MSVVKANVYCLLNKWYKSMDKLVDSQHTLGIMTSTESAELVL